MVRSSRPLRQVGELVQTHASALDPSLPFSDPSLLTASIERTLSNRRVLAWVFSLLGVLGFVLAAVGLHGLLAQAVIERTREFGIRLAIGAARTHVAGLVVRQVLWIVVIGTAAGLVLAALGARLVAAQLFGLAPLEPSLYLASASALILVVVLACAWPAARATRIEPVEALRVE
jgi:ABC-type antimicrobial peptide transport system permease subunit